MYRATVHVSTVPARPDWGLGNSAKELMRNFVLNIGTFEVAEEVIARAQLDMHPSEFLRLTMLRRMPLLSRSKSKPIPGTK